MESPESIAPMGGTTTGTTALEPKAVEESLSPKPLMGTLRENLDNPFRSRNNLLYTKSLFVEHYSLTLAFPMFTLKDKDYLYKGKLLPSLYRLYMEEEDLTEFSFAHKHLESYDHWQQIVNCEWFKPYIQRWRTELELKIKSRALKNIQAEAAGQTKTSFIANKWLAERGWVDKTTEPNRRGRPSKEEINRRLQEEAFNNKEIEDDLKRLGLN